MSVSVIEQAEISADQRGRLEFLAALYMQSLDSPVAFTTIRDLAALLEIDLETAERYAHLWVANDLAEFPGESSDGHSLRIRLWHRSSVHAVVSTHTCYRNIDLEMLALRMEEFMGVRWDVWQERLESIEKAAFGLLLAAYEEAGGAVHVPAGRRAELSPFLCGDVSYDEVRTHLVSHRLMAPFPIAGRRHEWVYDSGASDMDRELAPGMDPPLYLSADGVDVVERSLLNPSEGVAHFQSAISYGFMGKERALVEGQSEEPTEDPPTHGIHPLHDVRLGLADDVADAFPELLEEEVGKGVDEIRLRLAFLMGVPLDRFAVRRWPLEAGRYAVSIREAPAIGGSCRPGALLALDPEGLGGELSGDLVREPIHDIPARWIPETEGERAESLGLTVVEAREVMLAHLSHVVKTHMSELLTLDHVDRLLTAMKEKNPVLVADVVPWRIMRSDLLRLLRRLLAEGIPVRDLRSILEVVAERSGRVALGDAVKEILDAHETGKVRNLDHLVEAVRRRLAPTITRWHENVRGEVSAITLGPGIEALVDCLLDPERVDSIEPTDILGAVEPLEALVARHARENDLPVLIVAPHMRAVLRQLLVGRGLRSLPVLSYTELTPEAVVSVVGTWEIATAS